MTDFCKGADGRQYDTTPASAKVFFSLGQRGSYSAGAIETLPLSELLPKKFWNHAPKPKVFRETFKSGYLILLPYRNLSDPEDRWFKQAWAFRLEQIHPWTAPAFKSPPPSWQLRSLEPREIYLAKAQKVLDEIRAGRFYQLNLCRYFEFANEFSTEEILRTIASSSEPYRCYVENHDKRFIASLSPEQFIQISPKPADAEEPRVWEIRCSPIKGTAPRSADVNLDAEHRSQLSSSAKDQAELAMILDLMRHDLMKVCYDRSVRVLDPGSVHSFMTVHHLVGSLEGRLREDLSLGELFEALCPSGSITGAPKKEVCQAIQELEGRERQFFMGNMFFISDSGWLDSSVLIRTAVGDLQKKCVQFAAGSGITLKSQTEQELAEIDHKTRCFGTQVK